MSIPKLYDLKENTIIPHPTSQEYYNYLINLKIDNENLFLKAINNLPTTDINYVFEKTNMPQSVQNLNHIRTGLVFNLLTNRICENCGDKSNIIKLKICSECCLSWYCSEKCQHEHWDSHKLRCCKPDAPLDNGYQKITLVNTA